MIRKNFFKIKRGSTLSFIFLVRKKINLNRYNSINIRVENICLDSVHKKGKIVEEYYFE